MSSSTPRHLRFPALLLALASLIPACAAKQTTPPGGQPPTDNACTTEAKICPDGSGVGRTGPDCAFAPCPGPAATDPAAPPADAAAPTP